MSPTSTNKLSNAFDAAAGLAEQTPRHLALSIGSAVFPLTTSVQRELQTPKGSWARPPLDPYQYKLAELRTYDSASSRVAQMSSFRRVCAGWWSRDSPSTGGFFGIGALSTSGVGTYSDVRQALLMSFDHYDCYAGGNESPVRAEAKLSALATDFPVRLPLGSVQPLLSWETAHVVTFAAQHAETPGDEKTVEPSLPSERDWNAGTDIVHCVSCELTSSVVWHSQNTSKPSSD